MQDLKVRRKTKRNDQIEEQVQSMQVKKPLQTRRLAVRVTEEDYQKILKEVERTGSLTISTYLKRLIKQGLK